MTTALPPTGAPARFSKDERLIIALVAAAQFVNILDFVMVMPLGPDFSRALDMPASHLGYIGGSYTLSAAISGVAGTFFLDRFGRRKVLAIALAGLAIGTFLGAFAWSFESLLAARLVAGLFGGPATSASFAIVADVIPPARRGRAMGTIMMSFSLAQVLGVPAGLELSRRLSWHAPFIAVGAICLAVSLLVASRMPALDGHVEASRRRDVVGSVRSLLSKRLVWLSFLVTSTAMVAGFAVIPNIATFVQFNLGYPREHLWMLYSLGGVASFAALKIAGQVIDRMGSAFSSAIGALILSSTLYFGFVAPASWLPIPLMFVCFMTAMAFRNSASSTLATKVPGPLERAAFQSIGSSVQHLASATGALLSSRILVDEADHRLSGMDTVATISIVLTLLLPVLVWQVESRLSPEARGLVAPGKA